MGAAVDPFALFDLTPRYDIDAQELERRYRELQRALHPDRHAQAAPAARRMNLAKAVEVNEAYRVLRDDLKRAETLLERYGVEGRNPSGQEASTAADPAFLMEIMELREALSEARQSRDLERAQKLAQQVGEARLASRARLAETLDSLAKHAGDAGLLQQAQASLGRLKYYHRFLDEVAIVEEEALG